MYMADCENSRSSPSSGGDDRADLLPERLALAAVVVPLVTLGTGDGGDNSCDVKSKSTSGLGENSRRRQRSSFSSTSGSSVSEVEGVVGVGEATLI